ncbi:MAG: hypothetical protein WAU25_12245 [Nitrososphaeraceae archaeon]
MKTHFAEGILTPLPLYNPLRYGTRCRQQVSPAGHRAIERGTM